MLGVEFMPFAIVLGFILFDIVTGLIKAKHDGSYNSTIMREGGYHKSMEILAVVGSYGIEYAMNYIDIGVQVPLTSCVVIYICIMELISIIENVCAVNPEFCSLFKPYLDIQVGIAKKSPESKYQFGFKIHDEYLGLWVDFSTGKCYLSRKYSPGSGVIYALTNDDHDYNTILITRTPRPNWLLYIIKQYRLGGLYCEDEIIRRYLMDILKIVGV